jgi:hypothetical protein
MLCFFYYSNLGSKETIAFIKDFWLGERRLKIQEYKN